MIQLTTAVLRERVVAKCLDIGAPASMVVEIRDDRTIRFSHAGAESSVNDIPEFADPKELDCVLEMALIGLCHDIAQRAADLAKDIPFSIRLLAQIPGGRALALRWCRMRALHMSRELMK